SAGTTVVASNIGAFQRVLDYGELGALFENGDSEDLASVMNELIAAPDKRRGYVERANAAVGRYDWSVGAERILTVYEMVTQESADTVTTEGPHEPLDVVGACAPSSNSHLGDHGAGLALGS